MARQISQICLSKKASGSKKLYFFVVDILQTVLVVDLTFKFEFHAIECRFRDKIVRIFVLKLAQKYFLYTSLAAIISSFANIDEPVTFLLDD